MGPEALAILVPVAGRGGGGGGGGGGEGQVGGQTMSTGGAGRGRSSATGGGAGKEGASDAGCVMWHSGGGAGKSSSSGGGGGGGGKSDKSEEEVIVTKGLLCNESDIHWEHQMFSFNVSDQNTSTALPSSKHLDLHCIHPCVCRLGGCSKQPNKWPSNDQPINPSMTKVPQQ